MVEIVRVLTMVECYSEFSQFNIESFTEPIPSNTLIQSCTSHLCFVQETQQLTLLCLLAVQKRTTYLAKL